MRLSLPVRGEARRLAGSRAGRIGYYGTSQGGWNLNCLPPRWRPVILSLSVTRWRSLPLEEDREAIALDMDGGGATDWTSCKSI